jgi:hypothetical protein
MGTQRFTFEYVSKVCPELTKAECEAVLDHVLDTNDPTAVYPDVVRVAARSLFPYQARPVDNVVPIKGVIKSRLCKAREYLNEADLVMGRINGISDNQAQIRLDIQCVIHYLNEEIGDEHV